MRKFETSSTFCTNNLPLMLPVGLLLTVVAMAGLASTQSVDKCPTGVPMDPYTVAFKDACYQFVLYTKKDYPDAEADCESRGGTLALTKTTDVQQFLQKTAESLGIKEALWIGLNDQDNENYFVWVDGTPLSSDQSNWADGSGPREGIIQHRLEDCVTMDTSKSGKWIDFHCENELFGLIRYEKHYICSFKLTSL